MDVGNLISGSSSAFSKSNLNIWEFLAHVLLKPCLENFEHHLASLWNEHNCAVVWAFFGIAFGIGMKLTFSSPVATAEFSKFEISNFQFPNMKAYRDKQSIMNTE